MNGAIDTNGNSILSFLSDLSFTRMKKLIWKPVFLFPIFGGLLTQTQTVLRSVASLKTIGYIPAYVDHVNANEVYQFNTSFYVLHERESSEYSKVLSRLSKNNYLSGVSNGTIKSNTQPGLLDSLDTNNVFSGLNYNQAIYGYCSTQEMKVTIAISPLADSWTYFGNEVLTVNPIITKRSITTPITCRSFLNNDIFQWICTVISPEDSVILYNVISDIHLFIQIIDNVALNPKLYQDGSHLIIDSSGLVVERKIGVENQIVMTQNPYQKLIAMEKWMSLSCNIQNSKIRIDSSVQILTTLNELNPLPSYPYQLEMLMKDVTYLVPSIPLLHSRITTTILSFCDWHIWLITFFLFALHLIIYSTLRRNDIQDYIFALTYHQHQIEKEVDLSGLWYWVKTNDQMKLSRVGEFSTLKDLYQSKSHKENNCSNSECNSVLHADDAFTVGIRDGH
ncbi:hypothetical protein BC833DRAFT_619526 [Globomyces pollinis-pini]|nr:hypothetical protein BC833DRAFT_619526 [Globomyces pollinis-pini]